jgi:hypothetical protein
MGDYVYAFSEGGATVHRTADLQLMVELELPGNEPIANMLDGAFVSIEEEPDRVEEDSAESSEDSETHSCNEPDSENCED